MPLTKITNTAISGISNSSDATAITIDSSEKVGIGTTSPDGALHVKGASDHGRIILEIGGSAGNTNTMFMQFHNSGGTEIAQIQVDEGATDSGQIMFKTGGTTERMRIHNNGTVSIGTTSVNPVSSNVQGFSFRSQFGECQISSEGSSGAPLYLNRMTSDGDILVFRQDGSTEGQVSVSGSTVSYNGFSGLHESSGIATNTAIGTVVSTIDELDTYADGNKSGQTRANHAKVEVSDTVGDSAVYGVVASFNAHDKVNVASVGIGSVRVTGACAKGDLLESNGDGTAKVQSDDIVRSKTIGKVTIGNSSTDEKLVSCVLYCG